MSMHGVEERVLACGHRWSFKTPQRCGLCDCCPDCCKCDQDGTRAIAADQIRIFLSRVQGRRPKPTNHCKQTE